MFAFNRVGTVGHARIYLWKERKVESGCDVREFRSAHSLAYNRYTRKTGSRVVRRVSNEYLVSDIPWDAPKMSEESSEITEKGQRS